MDSQTILDELREVIRRLNVVEEKLGGRHTTINRIASDRYESLERYRVTYNRQLGLPDDTIHPPNVNAEDEID